MYSFAFHLKRIDFSYEYRYVFTFLWYNIYMKINHGIFILLISGLFFSCIFEKEEDIHYYHKCFFLGDTSF